MAQDEGSLNDFFNTLKETPSSHPNDALVPSGKRLCPICRAVMEIRTLMAITIDQCQEHGLWLDSGKLESITQATSTSNEYRHKMELNNAEQKGKVKGLLGGFGAFLPH